VAVVPGIAGIGGADYSDPVTFDAGFDTSMIIGAGLLVLASLVALAFIHRPLAAPGVAAEAPERVRIEDCPHCGINAPQMYPPRD
jgi:hypothetical protein